MDERLRMVLSLLDIMKKDLVELDEVEQQNFERMLDAVLEARGRGVPHEWLVNRLKKGSKDFLQLTDDEFKKYKWILSITPGAPLAMPLLGLVAHLKMVRRDFVAIGVGLTESRRNLWWNPIASYYRRVGRDCTPFFLNPQQGNIITKKNNPNLNGGNACIPL
jgi:hypothetical protein